MGHPEPIWMVRIFGDNTTYTGDTYFILSNPVGAIQPFREALYFVKGLICVVFEIMTLYYLHFMTIVHFWYVK